jgi:hypothetical protein
MTTTSAEVTRADAVDVLLTMRQAGQHLRDATLAGTRERLALERILRAIDIGLVDVQGQR